MHVASSSPKRRANGLKQNSDKRGFSRRIATAGTWNRRSRGWCRLFGGGPEGRGKGGGERKEGDDLAGRYVYPTLTDESPAVRSIRQAQVAAALEGDFEMVRLLQALVERCPMPETQYRENTTKQKGKVIR